MRSFTLNPLVDMRWSRFVDRHPRASIFHTRAWLDALHRTYGYEPVVYTTSSPSEELENGIAFCRIGSWLTGRRLVSLPFSDHCEPLVDNGEEWEFLVTSVIEGSRSAKCKYVEMRPLAAPPKPGEVARLAQSESFYLHLVDLRQELEAIFHNFHKTSVRGQIRRAEREKLSCVIGRSPEILRQFYRLLTATRRRHQLPPQPFNWFENLAGCLNDRLTIRLACKDGSPVASILTLSFRGHAYYKYSCSDKRFHNLGGTQMLLWQAIKEEKEKGAHILDLGRSDITHTSLAIFKDHWGGTRSFVNYYRYPPSNHHSKAGKWTEEIARYIFSRLPDSLLSTAGRLLYPHIG